VATGLVLQVCFVTAELSDAQQGLLEKLTCPVFQVSESVLDSLSDTMSTQGIIVIAERRWTELDRIFHAEAPLVLGLDRVQDPGNVGTLVRTAEAAGASGLLLFAGCADAYAPKTLRSAMGSAFRLPIIADVSGEGVISACRARGLKSVVACGDAETRYDAYDWRQPTLLILGNEGRGASDGIMAACDVRVRIPLHGLVESLNVAAAGAAILFEAARQRLSV
jgi:TrmH family RNA methyltransferase